MLMAHYTSIDGDEQKLALSVGHPVPIRNFIVSSPRHCADQSADNRTDRGGSERDPPGVAAAVMDVVNDMIPVRRRRAMRTMPPMPRPSNRRTRRQNHPSHENRNCLDDLVHITPTFPDFCPYNKQGILIAKI